MKKIFKRVSAAVIALAVAATAVVFDVPGKIIALATSAPPHDIHAVCGDANCDEHQAISDWKWIGDFDGGISSGNYYLYDDVTLTDEVTIPAGTDITLCLNGHTITVTESNKRIFEVNGGSLTLCDCKGTGTLTGGNITGTGGVVYVGGGGTFTMYGGMISDNTATIDKNNTTILTGTGGGVYVDSDGIFTMYGGKISDNDASNSGGGVFVGSGGIFTMYGGTISGNNTSAGGGGVMVRSGTFKMSGGTISDNTANSGGGVSVLSSVTFEMSGGTISNNTATFAGGVYAEGTFEMSGGAIYDNIANTSRGGGGVYVRGTFEMSGGTISNNTANGTAETYGGGGVYVFFGSFTMNGGTISGNTANIDGGGVYVYSGTFTMNDGTISGNTATNGGGVYNRGIVVTLNGKVDITGNKTSDNATSNVYLLNDKTLTIGDDFSTDSTIGVTTATAPTDCLTGTVAVTGTVSSDISGSFTADKEGQVVVYKDNTVRLALPHTYSDEWSSDDTNHWHECTSCGDKTDTAEHNFVDKSDETNHWQECSECGYKKDVTEHSWGDWSLTTEPTLTTTGAAERECSCGEKQTESDVPALTNSIWTKSNRTDPTLNGAGSEEYTSEYGTVTVTIPALNDTDVWTKDDTKHVEPTEETEGKDVYTSVYGEVTVTLDKLPHTLVHVDETPATETTEGTKEHWHCEGCGKNFADENGTIEMTETDLTIPVIDHTHTLTHVPEVPATETTAGTKEHWHCEGCGKNFADENGTTEMTDTDLTIPVIGHTHTLAYVPEVPATETTAGTKEHWHCEGCGKNFADEDGTTEMTDTDLTIPVIGHTHTLAYVPEVPATETTEGTKEHWHCEGCGKNFADENGTTEMTDTDLTIPVIGHTHTLTHVPEVPATETTAGTKEHWHCEGCGKNFADENGTKEVTADDLKIGKLETEVQAPVNVEIATPIEELITAALTEEEQQKITEGTDIKIILKVENATESVPAEDKGKVETEINGLSDYKLGQYLDITLLKKIGEEQEQKITKTNAPIKITFEIPEGLRGKAEYSVIRVHGGTATVLRDLDSDPNTVTIETDKFSTYALTYKEKTTTSNPSGGNSSGGNSGSRPSGGNSGGSSDPSTSTPTENDNSDDTSSDVDIPSRDDSSDTTSGESKPIEADNSDAALSVDGGITSSESDTSSGSTSSSDGSDHSPNESSSSEDNGNPSTGIAVSLIPLVTAAAILTVAVKCKKK